MFKMNSSEHFFSSTTSSRVIEGNTNNNNINISAASSSGSNCKTSSKDLEKLSVEIRKYPGDLVQGPTNSDQDRPPPPPPSFRKVGKESKTEQEDPEDEDLELSLGLSLGGKFGVDKSHMGLMRSSSISGNFPLIKEDDALSPPPSVAPALVRTSSLPVETEEEWRKRKEVQQLRRLAAKRRRSEKQRSSKESLGDASGSAAREDAKLNLNVRGRLEKEQQYFMSLGKKLSSSVASSFGSNLFVGGGGGGGGVGLKKISFFSSLQGLLAQQGSQGSGESQGCSSSGASEPEIKSVQGSSEASEARSPSSIQSQQERGASEVTCSGSRNPDPPSTQPVVTESRRQDDMPCVFTIGDPPRGRKVEGILYKYGKGEEVRIMCICHGSFFSPAEFVEHAGRRDVEHPLRHIVVNPSSSPFQ